MSVQDRSGNYQKYNKDGSTPISTAYRDLGTYIDGTEIAAGATLWGEWITDTQNYKNLVMMSKVDQAFSVLYGVSNSAGEMTGANGMTFKSGCAVSASYFEEIRSANFPLPYGCRFGIKNTSATPTTIAKLLIQLMG